MNKQETMELIEKLELPKVVANLYIENDTESNSLVKGSFRVPMELFLMTEKEQSAFVPQHIIPLFCDPDFYLIYAFDLETESYLRFLVEEGINEKRYNWDTLFIKDIYSWWELEYDSEEIMEAANSLGLEHANAILASLPSEESYLSIEERKSWESKMVSMFQ
ncbi:MAG: hypothetical protein NXI20_22675 [bacterium]|nr:hypothetical protein [bacterium]